MSKPVVSPPASPQILVIGQPVNLQIVATNSPGEYAATPLPAGLTLDAAAGRISGTVTTAGVTTTSITAINEDGTSAAVSLTWAVSTAPTGGGLWSDLILTINQGTRAVTAPGVPVLPSGAIFSIARGDAIDLLIGLEKYGVLADLGATVTIEVAPKEFEPESRLQLITATATRVQTSSLADTTRYRVRLTMTPENYAVLADYATETQAAMIAPVQIRMISGTKLICSDTFLVEILRDAVP